MTAVFRACLIVLSEWSYSIQLCSVSHKFFVTRSVIIHYTTHCSLSTARSPQSQNLELVDDLSGNALATAAWPGHTLRANFLCEFIVVFNVAIE